MSYKLGIMKVSMIELFDNLKSRFGEKEAKAMVEYMELKASRDLIRWMFIFWISQMVITITIILLFIL